MSFDVTTKTVIELTKDRVLWVEDGNHGANRPLASEFVFHGTPFIRPDDLSNGIVKFSECDRINDDALNRIRKGKGKAGDIVFTHRATVGRIARVGKDAPNYVANPGVTIYRSLNQNILDANYLYYFMQAQFFMQQVWAEAGNTDTFPYVSLTQQRRLKIYYPSINLQRGIGQLLGTLDDRITLLRETNTTLEAMAQALFKSWFVDFDPVHAKQQGCAPEGMDGATAALFPDSFEESELGMVPKGWRVGTVADLGSVVCGKTPPTSNSENFGNDVPFITIPDMHGVLAVTHTARALSKLGAGSQAKKYLPAGSICVSCIATPGLVVRVTRESQTNQQINSVIPLDKWGFAFPLFLLRRIGDAVRAEGSGGSVFHNLSKSGFEKIPLLLPDSSLSKSFNDLVEPVVAKIISNQQQAENLSVLRDTLLPRLISGQLRLPEAQEQRERLDL